MWILKEVGGVTRKKEKDKSLGWWQLEIGGNDWGSLGGTPRRNKKKKKKE